MVANYKRLGNAAFKAKEYPKAISYYEKAVNIYPEDISCWGNLAAILLESKAFSEVGGLCILSVFLMKYFLQSVVVSKKALSVGRVGGVASGVLEKVRTRIEKAKLGALDESQRKKEEGNER